MEAAHAFISNRQSRLTTILVWYCTEPTMECGNNQPKCYDGEETCCQGPSFGGRLFSLGFIPFHDPGTLFHTCCPIIPPSASTESLCDADCHICNTGRGAGITSDMMLTNGKFSRQGYNEPMTLTPVPPTTRVLVDSLIMASVVMKEYERDFRVGYTDNTFAPFLTKWGADSVTPIDYLGDDADVKATVFSTPLGDIFVEFRGSESQWDPDNPLITDMLKSTDYINTNMQFYSADFRSAFPTSVQNAIDASHTVDLGNYQVAAGWAYAVSKIVDKMLVAMNSAAEAHPLVSKCKVFFAGHSLGAAEATVAAAVYETIRRYVPSLLSVNLGPVVGVYTYGSPTVAQPSFASFYEDELGLGSKHVRWLYGFDVPEKGYTKTVHHDHVSDVPGLYPCGYVPVGQLLWVEAHIDSSSPLTDWTQRHSCTVGAVLDNTHFYIEGLQGIDKKQFCISFGTTKFSFLANLALTNFNNPGLSQAAKGLWASNPYFTEEMALGHGSYVAGLYDCLFQGPTYNPDYATECVNAMKFKPWLYGMEPADCAKVCARALTNLETTRGSCICNGIPSAVGGQKRCECPIPPRRGDLFSGM